MQCKLHHIHMYMYLCVRIFYMFILQCPQPPKRSYIHVPWRSPHPFVLLHLLILCWKTLTTLVEIFGQTTCTIDAFLHPYPGRNTVTVWNVNEWTFLGWLCTRTSSIWPKNQLNVLMMSFQKLERISLFLSTWVDKVCLGELKLLSILSQNLTSWSESGIYKFTMK